MEEIHVALASDGNYFPGLLVTAVSLARQASRQVSLVFHILNGGIGEANLSFLKTRLGEAHPAVEIRTYPVDEGRFAGFPEWNCGSRMPYARLLLPELVGASDAALKPTHILYCDVDFLWTADVAELWGLRSERRVLQACADGWCTTLDKEMAWYRARGIDVEPERYVCTGLLLINMRLWRDGGYGRKTMDFLRLHPDVLFVDQSAINAVVPEIGLLPRKWGRFSREMTPSELSGEWAIHFAGGAPWCSNWWTSLMTSADLMWYRFYGELTGMSAHAARKAFIGNREYAKRRLAYVLVRTPVVRQLFFMLLRLVGRELYIPALVGRRI